MLYRKTLQWVPIISAVGMYILLLGGALVTKLDAGRGCGSDWPLCHGKFIPAYTLESMIEYSHRAVSGIVGLLVLFTTILVWVYARKHKEALVYAVGALFFTLLQALLGFMAVKWPQSSAVLALHFGVSLLAFAGSLLLAIVFWRGNQSEFNGPAQIGTSSPKVDPPARTGMPSPAFNKFVWAVTVYCYLVVYIGAFVRHTDSEGGCSGWPLCNGQWVPELTGGTGIMFIHRLAALLLFIVVGAVALTTYRHIHYPQHIRVGSMVAFACIILQVLSGAFVTLSFNESWHLLASLLHTTIIMALFGSLCYLSARLYFMGRDRMA